MNFAIIGSGFISIKHAETIKKINGSKIIVACAIDYNLLHDYVNKIIKTLNFTVNNANSNPGCQKI